MNDFTNAIHNVMFSLIKYALCGTTGKKFYGNFYGINNVFASSIDEVFPTVVSLYERWAIFSKTGEYQSIFSPFQFINAVSLWIKYFFLKKLDFSKWNIIFWKIDWHQCHYIHRTIPWCISCNFTKKVQYFGILCWC